jgi:hypothetical protein
MLGRGNTAPVHPRFGKDIADGVPLTVENYQLLPAQRGLVARADDPADRRGTVVVLTDAGAEVQRRIGLRHAASIRRHLGPLLDDEELRVLRDLCARLQAAAAG